MVSTRPKRKETTDGYLAGERLASLDKRFRRDQAQHSTPRAEGHMIDMHDRPLAFSQAVYS